MSEKEKPPTTVKGRAAIAAKNAVKRRKELEERISKDREKLEK